MIRFIIPGEPVGKGRPRAFRLGKGIRMYTPKKTANYEDQVTRYFSNQCPQQPMLEGPLKMCVQAYFAIPKSMSKKMRQYAINRYLYAPKKPDADNIAKVVSDALNKFAYNDDAQIVEMTVTKAYSDYPRVEVTICKVDYAAMDRDYDVA